MRRILAVGLVLSAFSCVAPAVGMDTPSSEGPGPQVSIEFSDVKPAHIDVLSGDTVTWTNDSVRTHTVTDDAGGYDSGPLPSTEKFARMFEAAGTFPYHCRLHPYIRGEVDVWKLLVDQPPGPAQANHPFPLKGRAALPANTPVTIESDGGTGAAFHPVGSAVVALDGTFTAEISPTGSAAYRAVAGDQTSPPVQLLVLNHDISASARRGRRSTVVSVRVTPADPGGVVVLQLDLRERFGWWPVAQARLDRHSRARFLLHGRRQVRARARLTLPDGATPLATSALLHVGPPRR